MIRNPFMVLVCLAICLTLLPAGAVCTYSATDSVALPGVQADALSADTRLSPVTPSTNTYAPRPRSRSSYRSYGPHPPYRRQGPVCKVNPQPYCPPQGGYCGPGSPGGMLSGFAGFTGVGSLLPLPPMGIRPINPCSFLPRPGCRQFEAFARLWYSKLNSSTVVWGTNGIGGEGTELDLHNMLNLEKYDYLAEYGGVFHIRKNWSIRYTFMPLEKYENSLNEVLGGFWFGNAFFPQGQRMYVKWWRYIHRGELVYDWAQTRWGVSSIFAGYSLYDDKLRVSMGTTQRSRNRGFGLAIAGISINRLVADLSGGGKASLNCSWAMNFLEGYVGWDGHATGRITIPMNCGRYGYLEAGWRWIVLEVDEPSRADKVSLDGLSGSVGLVF